MILRARGTQSRPTTLMASRKDWAFTISKAWVVNENNGYKAGEGGKTAGCAILISALISHGSLVARVSNLKLRSDCASA